MRLNYVASCISRTTEGELGAGEPGGNSNKEVAQMHSEVLPVLFQ